MKPLDDDQYYFFKWQNDEGWILALHRVMHGYRVVVLHEKNTISVYGSYCCGQDYASIKIVFDSLFRFLETNPENVKEKTEELQAIEFKGTRPFGRNPKFVAAIAMLKPQTDRPSPLLSPEMITEKGRANWASESHE